MNQPRAPDSSAICANDRPQRSHDISFISVLSLRMAVHMIRYEHTHSKSTAGGGVNTYTSLFVCSDCYTYTDIYSCMRVALCSSIMCVGLSVIVALSTFKTHTQTRSLVLSKYTHTKHRTATAHRTAPRRAARALQFRGLRTTGRLVSRAL